MSDTPNNFVYVLLKNRIFIVKALFLVMVVTIAITYLIPKKYTSTTVILPPEDPPSNSMSIGGLSMGEFAGIFSGGMGYSLPLMTTLGDVYVEILNSRSVIDQTILSTGYLDSMDIADKYALQPEVAMYLARKQFKKNYSAVVTSSGFIELNVSTSDPLYSVEVSSRIIFLLDSINTSITIARLQESRDVTENQLAVAQASLQNTTALMLQFEDDYGTILPNEELVQVMGILAEMKGRYIEASLLASSVRNGLRYGTNAQLLELESTAQALKQSIDLIENGSPSGDVSMGAGLSNLPPAMIQYARLQTDFEMQLRMTTALELQVDQSLSQEQDIASSLRILDPPKHPGWKSKPKRLFIWIEVFLLTSVFLAAFLFGREKWNRLEIENPEEWNKWNNLKQEIKGDFRKTKEKRKGK